jgi:hypothetical protein
MFAYFIIVGVIISRDNERGTVMKRMMVADGAPIMWYSC